MRFILIIMLAGLLLSGCVVTGVDGLEWRIAPVEVGEMAEVDRAAIIASTNMCAALQLDFAARIGKPIPESEFAPMTSWCQGMAERMWEEYGDEMLETSDHDNVDEPIELTGDYQA